MTRTSLSFTIFVAAVPHKVTTSSRCTTSPLTSSSSLEATAGRMARSCCPPGVAGLGMLGRIGSHVPGCPSSVWTAKLGNDREVLFVVAIQPQQSSNHCERPWLRTQHVNNSPWKNLLDWWLRTFINDRQEDLTMANFELTIVDHVKNGDVESDWALSTMIHTVHTG